MNLAAVRAGLPVLQRVAYLNAGTFGPLPARTTAAMEKAGRAELESGRSGTTYWEAARALRARARESLGQVVGAEPENLALTRSRPPTAATSRWRRFVFGRTTRS